LTIFYIYKTFIFFNLFNFFIYIYLIKIELIKGITVNMMAYSYFSNNDFFQSIEDSFNNHSIENNLNVTLSINYFSMLNSTQNRQDLFSSIDYLLQRKSNKYDLYIFDSFFLKELYPHFIDLKEYLDNEYIDYYNNETIKYNYIYNGKWVGLVS